MDEQILKSLNDILKSVENIEFSAHHDQKSLRHYVRTSVSAAPCNGKLQ